MLGLRVSLALRPGRLLRRRAALQVQGRAVPRRDRLATTYPAAHVAADGYYTNKAPGGVAYRCSFRVTEASYLIERLVQNAAYELGMDPAEFRRKNFIQPDQFPYRVGDRVRLRLGRLPRPRWTRRSRWSATRSCARSRSEARAEGKLLGIGIASFTEVVGAGPSQGLRHPRAQDDRLGRAADPPHRQGDPQDRREDAGPGARDDVRPDRGRGARDPARATSRCMHGDTDNTPYGLGTYASRSTPDGRRRHRDGVAQDPRRRRKKLAAHLLEAAEEDVEFEAGRFSVKGAPDKAVTIQDVAFAAYTNLPDGHGGRARGRPLLRPAQPDLPVRDLRGRGRGRPRDRRVEGPPDGRGRRLRRADQPDDRRGPDPRRADRGVRHGGDAADHVRRGRATASARTSWTTCCRPRGRRRSSSCGET